MINNINEELYSLNKKENYLAEFSCNSFEISKIYENIIVEYLIHITKNATIMETSSSYHDIIRGLDTITNVFLNILFFTKNGNLTYFYCKKSYYFYTEFIEQISDDEKSFLKLTSKDATLYVYKKTIYELNNKYANNQQSNDMYETINNYIAIYKCYCVNLIKTTDFTINNILNISKTLQNAKNEEVKQISNIVTCVYYNISNIDVFFTFFHLLFENYDAIILQNIDNKIKNIENIENINNITNKTSFVKWGLNVQYPQ